MAKGSDKIMLARRVDDRRLVRQGVHRRTSYILSTPVRERAPYDEGVASFRIKNGFVRISTFCRADQERIRQRDRERVGKVDQKRGISLKYWGRPTARERMWR
jgi:hypothetical protein